MSIQENLTIYAISGLGADERVFQYLQLDFQLSVLRWIQPKKDESLKAYSVRFSRQIDSTSPFALLGVSFGGMMAVQLNTILKPAFTIIISSAAAKNELSFPIGIPGLSRLVQFMPPAFFKPPPFIAYWMFGVKERSQRRLLNEILKDTNPRFLKWSLVGIMKWNTSEVPENLFRIHGKKDRVIRFIKRKGQIAIQDGGHFMIIDKAAEISRQLNQIILFSKNSDT